MSIYDTYIYYTYYIKLIPVFLDTTINHFRDKHEWFFLKHTTDNDIMEWERKWAALYIILSSHSHIFGFSLMIY